MSLNSAGAGGDLLEGSRKRCWSREAGWAMPAGSPAQGYVPRFTPEGYWTVWEGVLAMWEPPRSTGLESSSLPLAKLLPSCSFRPFLEVSLTFLKEAPGFYSTLSLAS